MFSARMLLSGYPDVSAATEEAQYLIKKDYALLTFDRHVTFHIAHYMLWLLGAQPMESLKYL
jgi:hypothetical protein